MFDFSSRRSVSALFRALKAKDEKLSNFYNPSSLLWFPLMKTRSEKPVTFCSARRLFRVEYGPHCRWLPPQQVADLVGVSVKTVYKWMAEKHPMDPRAREVLYSKVLGLLPSDQWRGWHLDETGRLTAPNGYGFFPDELMALSYLKQHNGALQADVARLTVENRQLADALAEIRPYGPDANVIQFRPRRVSRSQKKPG